MSFNFGTTQPNTFGMTPKTTSAFGSNLSFGAPIATVAPTSTSTFGSPSFGTTPTPAFGSTAPTFGQSTFATPQQPSANVPSLFGTPSAAVTTKSTLFGTPATTTPSLFSTPSSSAAAPNLFGSTAAAVAPLQTATPSLFGGAPATQSLFGAAPPSGGSLFGTTSTGISATTTPLFGGFGTSTITTTTAGPSLFGGSVTGGTTSLFGAPPGTGSGLFGTGTFGASTGTTGLGGAFGTSTGFGGFGTTTGLFGAKQIQPVPQQPVQSTIPGTDAKTQQTLTSFYAINLFGDERDDVIKKWNMLQACWGTGKGYYLPSQPPITYDHNNPFFRFKAVGYVVMPTTDNADGFIKIVMSRKAEDIRSQKDAFVNGIHNLLGNKPNLTVNVEHIRPFGDTDCEIMLCVWEKGVTGASRKIHAADLASFLNQPASKQQLWQASCYYLGPYMTPTKAQLEDYFKTPPAGIDIHMWNAARVDNPKPEKFLPHPIIGFTSLKKRALCQQYETDLHDAFLEKVYNEINDLKKKHAASLAQIAEQKQKFMQLQHRVLRILVKQETTRKVGMALQPEEEMLRTRLELMHNHLHIPTQFRGKINEMKSTMKIMSALDVGPTEVYKLDTKVQEDIKQFLQMEQNGIAHLVDIINKDLHDLKIISEGMSQMLAK